MPSEKPNFTALAHQVVRESPEPLLFAEILQRVQAQVLAGAKDPKGPLRHAIGSSALIVATGDGRYGWKPRLITGSVLRLTLSREDLQGTAIVFGEELRDALWPAFHGSKSQRDEEPIKLHVPGEEETHLPQTFLGPAVWGTAGSPVFWKWLGSLKAQAGDHLIFTARDAEARRYAVEFEPRARRDEAGIAARNREVVAAALAFVHRKRRSPPPLWDVTTYLLASGQYQYPLPPDPFETLWTPAVWRPALGEFATRGMAVLTGGLGPGAGADALMNELRGRFEGKAPR